MKRRIVLSLSVFFLFLASIIAFAQPPNWRPGQPYPQAGRPYLPSGSGLRSPAYPPGLRGIRPRPTDVIVPARNIRSSSMHGPIEICPTHNCSTTTVYTPNPLGIYADLGDDPVFVLKVNSASGGGNLGVWFESSCDDGHSWEVVAGSNAFSVGTYYMPVSSVASFASVQFSTPVVTCIPSPGYPANSVSQGPLGNRLRVECQSSNAGIIWQFQALVLPGSHNHLR
jgi:hypothetical protein